MEFEWSGVNIKNYFLEHHPTTAFLSGDMILKIEYEQLVNQPSLPRLNNTFKTKLYKSLAQEKNFTIKCQGGNNEKLLMAAFKFVKAHMGNFQKSDGWNQLMQTNPECMTRVMNFHLCNGK